MASTLAQLPDCREDITQRSMRVREQRNPRTLELRDQIALRRIRDDQVRAQRDDGFDVWVDQSADARQIGDLRRELIVTPDAHDLWAGADGEQDFSHCWDDRHNPLRCLRVQDVNERKPRDKDEPGEALRHCRRTKSQRKNGPPVSAVITPTGSSNGAMMVRATTSHPTRNAAPRHAEAGITTRWSAPTISLTR